MNIIYVIMSVCSILLSLLFINDGYLATLVFLALFILGGNLFALTNSDYNIRVNTRKIFNYSFCIFSIYMVIVNSIYVSNASNDYFVYSDQTNYFRVSEMLSEEISIRNIFESAQDIHFGISQENNAYGAFTLFGVIAYYADYLDGNNIIIQKLSIVFISSLSIVFIFKTLLLKYPIKTAKKAAMLFASFSFILFYSSFMLRDIHILLFYVIAMYIIVQKYSNTRLLLLYVLFIVTFSFRKFSGLYFLSFPALYLYLNYYQKNMKYYIALLFIILIGLILTYYNPREIYMDWSALSTNMKNYSLSKTSTNALRLSFDKLPMGLNTLAKAAFSQMQPFPLWGFLHTGNYPINERNILRLPEAVAGLSWFYAWIIAIYGMAKKGIRENIPVVFKALFYLAVIFIMLNAVEINIRRNIPVYPAIYMCVVYIYVNLSVISRKKIFIYSTIVYLSLNIVYLAIAL